MGDNEYDEVAWQASAGHGPLRDVDVNQVFLLHRHWIWSNYQRIRFSETLPRAPRPDGGAFLADECWASMYMWYATLWSVIEGFADRDLDIRGLMHEDIERMADGLRRCRNAVFHVSRKDQNDERLFEFMAVPDAVAAIYRISSGFGRMFMEEHAFRQARGDFGNG